MNGKRVEAALFIGVVVFLLLITPFHPQLFPQTPAPIQSQYKHALKMLGEDKYAQAISELQQVIQGHPAFSRAYRNLVEAYIFINKLDAAQSYFENLRKDHPNNPYAYYGLARIDYARKEYDPALEKLKTCIELDPKFADAYSHRGGLPEVYRAKKDLDSAIQFFEQLIEKDLQNACAYYGLARSYIRKYDWDKALKLLEKALELDSELTLAYHAMIFTYTRPSRYDKVREISEELLKVARRTDDYEMVAYANMMIGISYRRHGDYLKALFYLNDALKDAQKIGAKTREGTCLNNLANVYALTGNYLKAMDYFKEALRLKRKTGARLSEVRTLGNLGTVYQDLGSLDDDPRKYEEAFGYFQEALEIAQKYGYRTEESNTLSQMAKIFEKQGHYNKALAYQSKALEIARMTGNKSREGFSLRDLGRLYKDVGNPSAAINYYRQALEIGLATKNVELMWESRAGLGLSFQNQGDLHEAMHHYARAVALYDSVKESLDLESLGKNFFENKYEAHPRMVSLLSQNGEYKEAFEVAEKYKAKTILDILSQGQNYFGRLLADTLNTSLQQINSALDIAHTRLSKELTKNKKDESIMLSIDQQITDLQLKRAAIIEDLKKRRRADYQVTSPEILDVVEIQARILSRDQALVEYIVGPENISIFVVTSDSLINYEVAIGSDRLRTMLADLSPLFDRQKSTEKKNGKQIFNPELADFSIPPNHALYEVIFKPVEPFLRDAKELVIVPDDVLFYLPFEMLVFDTTGIETPYDFEHAKFLLQKFEISYSSSASLLDPRLQKVRKPRKGILALGNPSFEVEGGETNLTEYLASNLVYSGSVLRGGSLVPLPNAEAEVKGISKALTGSKNRIFIGNRATEENFKANAEDYRILHFATHFLSMEDQPLYSKIVLAQQDKTKEDGYLQTYEVFNMNLNADLVVLSACNSALGKLRKGEGLIGISRAFLSAGVPSLIASLWSVDDQATSLIMKKFYQRLNEGLNKKQALRFAKIDYLKSSHTSGKDPFYWAPFILIGDWSPVHLPPPSTRNMWIISTVLILLIVVATTLMIRSRRRFASST